MSSLTAKKSAFLLLLFALFSINFIPVLGADETTMTTVHEPGAGALDVDTALLTDEDIEQLELVMDDVHARIEFKEIGLYVSRYDDSSNLLYRIRYNENKSHAIASTYKAFASFYYFMNVPESDWEMEYGDNVNSMVVYSNNTKTGNLLWNVSEYIRHEDRNPIEKFNDFLHHVLGVSEESGVYSWDHGFMQGTGYTDLRYIPYPYAEDGGGYVEAHGRFIPIGNRFTAADAGIATEFIALALYDEDADPKVRKAAENTRYLMSINDPLYPTTFDKIAHNLGTWRKYGYLGPEEIGTAALTETIVVPLYDGGFLSIAALSTDERGASYPLELERIFGNLVEFEHKRLLETYPEPDFSDIPIQEPNFDAAFNYGLVKPLQIEIFSEPDDSAEQIENAFRRDMAFPVSNLYSGALIEFTPVDEEWGEILWHDRELPFQGVPAYVRLEDLHIISYDFFSPITVTEPQGDNPIIKYIVLEKENDTMALFEDNQLILRTPALMNLRLTPDGSNYVYYNYASRPREDFPFVGFVGMFGDNYQAFVSTPWEWWDETVREHYKDERYTRGDVHVPDWELDIPGYGVTRFDTFLFRWLGGIENPADSNQQRAVETIVRVYSIWDDLDEVYGYALPLVRNGDRITWDTIIAAIADADITVPDYFYDAP